MEFSGDYEHDNSNENISLIYRRFECFHLPTGENSNKTGENSLSFQALGENSEKVWYSRDGHLVGGGGDGRLLHAGGLLEAGGRLLEAGG